MVDEKAWAIIGKDVASAGAKLIAVSKTKPASDILMLHKLGQRAFGENYVQELVGKSVELPKDIEWHFIGHLQSNKVKYIAPFVEWIHGVDSFRLLLEINKEALKNNRVIHVLLQMHIAQEDTKFGLDEKELKELLSYYEAQMESLKNIRICGLMGMASNTDEMGVVRSEYQFLKDIFQHLKETTFLQSPYFTQLSMGMSGDYKTALEEGSTMIRVGSLIFGSR